MIVIMVGDDAVAVEKRRGGKELSLFKSKLSGEAFIVCFSSSAGALVGWLVVNKWFSDSLLLGLSLVDMTVFAGDHQTSANSSRYEFLIGVPKR